MKKEKNIKVSAKNKKKKQLARARSEDYKQLKRKYKLITNILLGILVICCLVFLIRVKTHVVSGQSMEPTFANGDRIFVTKGQKPKRYDIITFRPLDKPKESYVKRVVGEPGDTIWLEENKLYINHQMKHDKGVDSEQDLRAIDLPDGTTKIDITVDVMKQLQGMRTIPKDHYFVLGDNRNHSTDSRWLGFIQSDQIEGVVSFRYYPFTKIGFVR